MKKIKIFSGTSFMLFLMVFYLCVEIGCFLLCFSTDVKTLPYTLLGLWSAMFCILLLLTNRTMTIVTYDPEKGIVTRRGLFWGFYRELRVADIIRTDVRMIPKEGEYILLIDKEENQHFDSMSPKMPIRIPNTAKGREFVANFYNTLGK